MILLRIYPSTSASGGSWDWVLIENGRMLAEGRGKQSELPGHAARTQLVLPAHSVLLTRAQLPGKSKQINASVLAFALEEQTATEPEANTVIRLGPSNDAEAMAVTNGPMLAGYRKALEDAGITACEILCETLMLPLKNGVWSLGWNGNEGFVRTANLEGFTTDTGQRTTPPLSLRLRVDEAREQGEAPAEICVHPSSPDAVPDIEQWQQQLGLPVRLAESWTWRSTQSAPLPVLLETRRRWTPSSVMLSKLRPAAWLTVTALALHLAATSLHGLWLAHEQRSMRQDMEARFRSAFPDAVAVVDPALQMRRKLAEVRHAAGLPDGSDFLPLLDRAAPLISELPAGSIRNLTYGNGRMTLELHALDTAGIDRLSGALQRAGLTVERSGSAATDRSATRITISAS